MPPEQFSSQFQQMARANGLKSGDRVWVFDAGWGVNLARGLPKDLSEISLPGVEEISVKIFL